jgi:hypothetical protein
VIQKTGRRKQVRARWSKTVRDRLERTSIPRLPLCKIAQYLENTESWAAALSEQQSRPRLLQGKATLPILSMFEQLGSLGRLLLQPHCNDFQWEFAALRRIAVRVRLTTAANALQPSADAIIFLRQFIYYVGDGSRGGPSNGDCWWCWR